MKPTKIWLSKFGPSDNNGLEIGENFSSGYKS